MVKRYIHTSTSDEHLMAQAKLGTTDPVEVLFQRYQSKLFNFFLRLTYDRDISEDLTQNVFYRVIRYRNSYNEAYAFRTWLYQLARNVHRDYYQKQKRQINDSALSEKAADLSQNAMEQMEQDERVKTLEAAMAQLPEAQRELLWLSRYEGMKYQEIAEIMGASETAIKTRVHRAMNKLREIYFQIQ